MATLGLGVIGISLDVIQLLGWITSSREAGLGDPIEVPERVLIALSMHWPGRGVTGVFKVVPPDGTDQKLSFNRCR